MTTTLRTHRRSTIAAALPLLLALAACGDDPFQVIEETEFAASLGVDLAAMEMLPSGVYIQDIEPGTGEALTYGAEVSFTWQGWLADGTEWLPQQTTGSYQFLEGEGAVQGFNLGVLGMQEGGTRLIVVPPELAYGDEEVGSIPPGAILVFRVKLDTLVPPS